MSKTSTPAFIVKSGLPKEKKESLCGQWKSVKSYEVMEVFRDYLEYEIELIQKTQDNTEPDTAFKAAWDLAFVRGRKKQLNTLLSLLK